MSLLSRLPRSVKSKLRAGYSGVRLRFVQTFMSYGPDELADSLRALGIRRGDSVMLHAAFVPHYGFRGSISDLIDTFLDVVGPEGNLLMVSLPYRTSSLEYLSNLKLFDVRKTPSMMGLVSEYYRRRPTVLRSLHPTHPILASGPKAEWLLAEHSRCRYPCGPDSPFERWLALDGKAVFFNVPFDTFTFFHYLEHVVSGDLPFALYTTEFEVPVIDANGDRTSVTTCAFALEAIRRRRFPILESEMRQRGLVKERRIGNSRLLMARARDAVDCVESMRREGRYFYDLTDVVVSERSQKSLIAGDQRAGHGSGAMQ